MTCYIELVGVAWAVLAADVATTATLVHNLR